ncbi:MULTISPECIES: hypothetical protein [Leptolyngbya]|uniref:hypothetical protein n=1 Tax=Leptolyngbya TaxID=47251 RepID=UPI0011819F7A|nr:MULTISPECIES: hypothetical protein [Leptolyngbya]MBD2372684.1 hypothetical protein [Leptolyngbya sp. FACHB-238]MBD2397107.1 hypothetical protein [Leptolyngbya sp. FACHB-239]MBD2403631.1 hypothetical protein [Leptolyngbya sp. FACHB-402]ULP27561.1 hypothetical protein MCP04_16100 [Leptolyngbya boryana IU 594]
MGRQDSTAVERVEPLDHSTPGRLKGYRKTFKNSPHGCSSQVLGLERIELAVTLFNVIKRNCTAQMVHPATP